MKEYLVIVRHNLDLIRRDLSKKYSVELRVTIVKNTQLS